MSYSSLMQSLPEFWRSSHGLAALASLGFHGLLLVVLPLVPLDSQEVQLQRTIGLVKLTPEEQSRLPQVALEQANVPYPATAQNELPPLPSAQPFQSEILPPLPPPPPSFLPPPPPSSTPIYQFPLSNSLPPVPNTPSIQVPLPPPPQNNQSVISRYPFGQLPEAEQPQVIRLRQLPLPSPSAIPPGSNLPSTNALKPSEPFSPNESQSSLTTQLNNSQTQNQVATANQASPQAQPQISTITPLPEKTKREVILRRNQIRQQLANRKATTPENNQNQRLAALQRRLQQSPTGNTPSASTSDSNRTQRLTALRQRLQQSPAANTPQASASDSNRSQRLTALRQRLQKPEASSSDRPLSTATTQTLAQLEAFEQRQQKIHQNPEVKTKAPIRDKIKTCNRQLSGGVAVLAAVVNPQGKIISGPDLLSKPSAAVRRAAVNYVKKYSFPKTDNPTNQQFRLEFQYDSGGCAVTSQKKKS